MFEDLYVYFADNLVKTNIFSSNLSYLTLVAGHIKFGEIRISGIIKTD